MIYDLGHTCATGFLSTKNAGWICEWNYIWDTDSSKHWTYCNQQARWCPYIRTLNYHHWMHAESLQLCPTCLDTMDCSLQGSSVHGILQARTLECVAISFSTSMNKATNKCARWFYGVVFSMRKTKMITCWMTKWQRPFQSGGCRRCQWGGDECTVASLREGKRLWWAEESMQ